MFQKAFRHSHPGIFYNDLVLSSAFPSGSLTQFQSDTVSWTAIFECIGKKIIQYLVLAEKRLWSILFVGPEKMSAEQIREIDADAASFRLRAAAQ